MEEIDISEFKRVEMRVGRVVKASRVAGTDRLLLLEVDFGGTTRRALTGLGHLYDPSHFEGKLYVFVTNLKPRKVRGLVSECMILAAMTSEEKIVPVAPESEIEPGASVM